MKLNITEKERKSVLQAIDFFLMFDKIKLDIIKRIHIGEKRYILIRCN